MHTQAVQNLLRLGLEHVMMMSSSGPDCVRVVGRQSGRRVRGEWAESGRSSRQKAGRAVCVSGVGL